LPKYRTIDDTDEKEIGKEVVTNFCLFFTQYKIF